MAWNKLSPYCTTVSSDNQYMRVTYHSTDIVKWSSSEIILNTEGWMTSTTKRKMNQAANQFGLGFAVYQDDYIWYVTFKGQTMLYKDNMVLTR